MQASVSCPLSRERVTFDAYAPFGPCLGAYSPLAPSASVLKPSPSLAASGPSPVDRGRPGSKHHLLVEVSGIPLAFSVTGGNRNDITQLIPLLDGVPAVRGAVGRPRRGPDTLIADRGYDHDKYRRLLWQRGVKPVIARRQTEHGSGLGRYRWVVERTFAWLHNFKRLLVRYERRADIHHALLALGCCLVCYRRLKNSI
jgi:transposase